jgi:hypothetical protein
MPSHYDKDDIERQMEELEALDIKEDEVPPIGDVPSGDGGMGSSQESVTDLKVEEITGREDSFSTSETSLEDPTDLLRRILLQLEELPQEIATALRDG